jgi:hypothetical protein
MLIGAFILLSVVILVAALTSNDDMKRQDRMSKMGTIWHHIDSNSSLTPAEKFKEFDKVNKL